MKQNVFASPSEQSFTVCGSPIEKTVTEGVLATFSLKVILIACGEEVAIIYAWPSESTETTVGAVVSIVKLETDKGALALFAASVTVIVQLEYVPSARELNVIGLFPAIAEVVALKQEPP